MTLLIMRSPRWLGIIVLQIMVSILSLSYASAFTDVPPGSFLDTAVNGLQQRGIITGYADGSIKPQQHISRAEFVAIIGRVLPEQALTTTSRFPDVPTESWYAPSLYRLVASGIISGYTDGTFRPDASVSRAEAIHILSKAFDMSTSIPAPVGFEDVHGTDWFSPAVSAMVSGGYLPRSTHFWPRSPMTREDAFLILYRITHNVPVELANTTATSTPTSTTPPTTYDAYYQSLPTEDQLRIKLFDSLRSKVVSVIAGATDDTVDYYLKSSAYGELSSSVMPAYSITHGTGFFVDRRGYVITNKHVVINQDLSYRIVLTDGRAFKPKAIHRDPVYDIALIELDAPGTVFEPVTMLESSRLPFIGQTVYSIGNTLGKYPYSVSRGIISQLGRIVTAYGDGDTLIELMDLIQTDANISQGNSGGPLIDSKGIVVGMTTAYDQDAENLGFALPTKYIASAIASFRASKKITTPFLGVRYVHLNQDLAKRLKLTTSHGAYIMSDSGEPSVIPGSPAAKAGLKEGDIILQVNTTKLDAKMSLLYALALYRGDKDVVMIIQRGNDKKRITVTPEQK